MRSRTVEGLRQPTHRAARHVSANGRAVHADRQGTSATRGEAIAVAVVRRGAGDAGDAARGLRGGHEAGGEARCGVRIVGVKTYRVDDRYHDIGVRSPLCDGTGSRFDQDSCSTVCFPTDWHLLRELRARSTRRGESLRAGQVAALAGCSGSRTRRAGIALLRRMIAGCRPGMPLSTAWAMHAIPAVCSTQNLICGLRPTSRWIACEATFFGRRMLLWLRLFLLARLARCLGVGPLLSARTLATRRPSPPPVPRRREAPAPTDADSQADIASLGSLLDAML